MSRLDALTLFVEVIDRGGFSAAGRALGLSPSAVSKQIAMMEERLGARLMHRTTRRMTLTEVGRAFYDRSRAILAALDEAERSVTDMAARPRGLLRVSAPVHFGQFHLSPVLTTFLDRHPDVSLDIDLTDRYVDLVGEGLDVAVRIGAMRDSSLISRRLAPNRRVVAASPAYLSRHGVPATPDDLADHNCLTFTTHSHHVDWRFETNGEKPRSVRVTGTLRTNDLTVLRNAAIGGLGIVRISSFFTWTALRSGDLVPLLTDYETQENEVRAVYPAARHLSPTVRAFVDHLVATIGQPAYWAEVGLG